MQHSDNIQHSDARNDQTSTTRRIAWQYVFDSRKWEGSIVRSTGSAPWTCVCLATARRSKNLGYYDPMVKDADARAVLKAERIDYWLGVGAQPSEKVRVLIKKYGTNGTHLNQQQAALERLKSTKPQAPPPMVVPRPKKAAAGACAGRVRAGRGGRRRRRCRRRRRSQQRVMYDAF